MGAKKVTIPTITSPGVGDHGAPFLPAGVVGGGVGVGGEPFVEGDGEGEEFVRAVEGVDHFDVEFGVFERGVVEILDVVEEVAGKGGVGLDAGGFEAEVVVILGDLFVDGSAFNGEGIERDVNGLSAAEVEEAAVDVVFGGGGNLVVVGRDELDACVFEREGAVAVVGDDDADGQEAVLNIGQAEEGALFGVVARLGGDGDVLVGVGVVGGVFCRGLGGRGGFLVCGARCEGGEAQQGGGQNRSHGCGGECAESVRDARVGLFAMRAHAGLIMIFADTVVKPGCIARS